MKIAIVGSGNGAVTAAVDMVNQGHEVKLYCRNSSIHKFDRALKKVDLILIMKVMKRLYLLQILVMILNMY